MFTIVHEESYFVQMNSVFVSDVVLYELDGLFVKHVIVVILNTLWCPQ